MLFFLKQIFEAIDYGVDNEVLTFYTDFSKAFDRVPHFELLRNMSNVGVGGRILEGLFDYLPERKEYAMVENFKRDELEVMTGV